MPWPPTSLPSSTPVTDATTQRTQHASDHNALAVIANGVLATAWVLVNPTGGAAPAFVSPWVNYSPGIGSGWQVLRFRKQGLVTFRHPCRRFHLIDDESRFFQEFLEQRVHGLKPVGVARVIPQ